MFFAFPTGESYSFDLKKLIIIIIMIIYLLNPVGKYFLASYRESQVFSTSQGPPLS